MHKKFEIDQAKIKGGCQSGRKVITHNSKSDLPLVRTHFVKLERQKDWPFEFKWPLQPAPS